MLIFDPKKRPSAQECLQHPYFHGVQVPKLEPPKSSHGAARKTKPQGFGVAGGVGTTPGGHNDGSSMGRGTKNNFQPNYNPSRGSPGLRKVIPSRDKPAEFKNSFYKNKGDILERAEKFLKKDPPAGGYHRENSGGSGAPRNSIPSRTNKSRGLSGVKLGGGY